MQLPRVIFGSSALGNLFVEPTREEKLALVKAWLDTSLKGGATDDDLPVVIDSAGKYGAGLSLECIGQNLRELGADPAKVVISNKLGWRRVPLTTPEPTFEPGAWVGLEHDAEQRISREGIVECWRQGCELIGEPYRPRLASVHDPDEFLAAAANDTDRQQREKDLYEAYEALAELKAAGEVQAVGVGSKDWTVARDIAERVDLDWVMIANCLTIYTHPPELIAWVAAMAERGVTVINSAVFNAGFLVGGRFYNYREVSESDEADKPLFAWREKFFSLCERHGVDRAAACVRFALSPPGVASIAAGTSKPHRVEDFLEQACAEIPNTFWEEAKSEGLIDDRYPHVPLKG